MYDFCYLLLILVDLVSLYLYLEKQILQAYTGYVSKSMISKKTGVSRNTVKRFIREIIAMDKSLEEILSMSDSALELLFKANPTHEYEPRYRALIAFFPEVDKALKKRLVNLLRKSGGQFKPLKGDQFVRFMHHGTHLGKTPYEALKATLKF